VNADTRRRWNEICDLVERAADNLVNLSQLTPPPDLLQGPDEIPLYARALAEEIEMASHGYEHESWTLDRKQIVATISWLIKIARIGRQPTFGELIDKLSEEGPGAGQQG